MAARARIKELQGRLILVALAQQETALLEQLRAVSEPPLVASQRPSGGGEEQYNRQYRDGGGPLLPVMRGGGDDFQRGGLWAGGEEGNRASAEMVLAQRLAKAIQDATELAVHAITASFLVTRCVLQEGFLTQDRFHSETAQFARKEASAAGRGQRQPETAIFSLASLAVRVYEVFFRAYAAKYSARGAPSVVEAFTMRMEMHAAKQPDLFAMVTALNVFFVDGTHSEFMKAISSDPSFLHGQGGGSGQGHQRGQRQSSNQHTHFSQQQPMLPQQYQSYQPQQQQNLYQQQPQQQQNLYQQPPQQQQAWHAGPMEGPGLRPPPPPPRVKPPCYDFTKGRCTRSNCSFSHAPSVPPK